MKRYLILLLALLASPAFAQEKPDEHGRGYVQSPFAKQLKAESHAKHGKRLMALQQLDLPEKFETPFQIPQQNQGSCGSCWDVSACRAISCAYVAAGLAKGDGSFVISADTVMWCYSTGGCSGDDASTVFRIAKKDGLPINADVGEYKATGRGPCNKSAKRYKIGDSGNADANNDGYADYNEIKAVILAHGACVITVDAGALVNGEEVSTYRGRGTDHQIIVVGWDDTKKGGPAKAKRTAEEDKGGGEYEAAGHSGALLCVNQWGNWGFEHNGQMGFCWLGAFDNGHIAASGSEEVLWCRVENPNPPTPPVPPVPVPPVPPAPAPTVTFTIPAYSFTVPGVWGSSTVTIPARTITAPIAQPKSGACEDCSPVAPVAQVPLKAVQSPSRPGSTAPSRPRFFRRLFR
jgi:hypothetical protein